VNKNELRSEEVVDRLHLLLRGGVGISFMERWQMAETPSGSPYARGRGKGNIITPSYPPYLKGEGKGKGVIGRTAA